MGADYADMEREFVAALGEDTGRDLGGWIAAIAATGLADRNAIIDWLRHQGFTFSRASWLERIHHNGGRLIYADGANENAKDEPPKRADHAVAPVARPQSPAVDLGALLAHAKGLRPLADLVLREIAAAAPGARFEAHEPLIVAVLEKPFAALLPHPKKLRLFAEFDMSSGFDIRAAEAVNKAAAPFPKMLLLDDARRVDAAFRALLAAAARAKT